MLIIWGKNQLFTKPKLSVRLQPKDVAKYGLFPVSIGITSFYYSIISAIPDYYVKALARMGTRSGL